MPSSRRTVSGSIVALTKIEEAEKAAEVPLPSAEPVEVVALQKAVSSDVPAPPGLPPAELSHEQAGGEGEKSVAEEDHEGPATLSVLEPTPVIHSHQTLLIGIAGATASGKTRLAHLLSSTLPSTPCYIVHQNDFFVPNHFLVPDKEGRLDADSREVIDSAALLRVLRYAKREGSLPPGYQVMQNQDEHRELAGSLVEANVIDELKEAISSAGVFEEGQLIVIVCGFQLFHEADIRDILDVKLCLRARREQSMTRRLEKIKDAAESADHEFWRTQEYFERAAWPHYVSEYGPLFEDGDVEGTPLFELCAKLGIEMQPELDMNAELLLRWTVTGIVSTLQRQRTEQRTHLEEARELDPEISLLKRYEACDCCDGWLGRVRKALYDFV